MKDVHHSAHSPEFMFFFFPNVLPPMRMGRNVSCVLCVITLYVYYTACWRCDGFTITVYMLYLYFSLSEESQDTFM